MAGGGHGANGPSPALPRADVQAHGPKKTHNNSRGERQLSAANCPLFETPGVIRLNANPLPDRCATLAP